MFNKRLLVEFKETRSYIARIVALQWLMLIVNTIFIYSTSKFVGVIFENKITNLKIYHYVIVAVIAILLRVIFIRISSTLSNYVSSGVKTKMRSLIYNKLICIGMDYMDWCPSSEIVQLSTEGVEQLDIYFGKYIPQFFYALFAPLTLFVIVSFIYFPAAIILLICVPLIPIAIIIVQKFAKKLLDKYWGIFTDLGDTFLENLQGLTTMKIYNSDGFYAKKMHKDSENFRKITMRVLIMQLNSISIMDIVAYGGSAIGMLISVIALLKGKIIVSQCFFIIMISSEFFLPMRLLGSYFHIAMNGNSAADRIFKILDIPFKSNGKNIEIIPEKGDTAIEFKDVSFTYKEDEKQVLSHINLIIPSHKIVGIVGKSGCGKSTVTSLIMGEHNTYQGEIYIQGIDRKDISEGACMKHITRIVHDNFLFSGTLWDNLYMGFPKEVRESVDISTKEGKEKLSEKMYQALREVRIYSFVMASGGLSMKIEPNASNLSGGQKQRIALARAILQDSEIYIFDEATSNIDVESEKKIMEAIYNLGERKTVIIISHRLSNIVKADKIIMMKDGKIVQQGTHEDLTSQLNSPYQLLYQSQQELEKYIQTESFDFHQDLDEEEEEEDDDEMEVRALSDIVINPKSKTSNSIIKSHTRKRSGVNVMLKLIQLVKPLTKFMLIAIFLGCLGHMAAIFITILGGYGIKNVIEDKIYHQKDTHLILVLTLLCVLAFARGFLRYGEQACNHYIAFKLLADIRDEIFDALRKLAPAKLEGKAKGHFISMIISDTELLEVFYAHTISPILIAIITSIIMVCFIGWNHWMLALIALLCYIVVGIFIPVINGYLGSDYGLSYREGVADLNTIVLDNLRGMREILQYRYQKEREECTFNENNNLRCLERKLKKLESIQTSLTNSVIIIGGVLMTVAVSILVRNGEITFEKGLLSIIAMMSSFGPTVAISSLSNNLSQTLACGERVLDLLEESPLVPDVIEGKDMPSGTIHVQNVTFAYPKNMEMESKREVRVEEKKEESEKELLKKKSEGKEEEEKEEEEEEEEEEFILKNYSNEFEKNKITGIIGRSGCGKSTLLKLLMRFFEPQEGQIIYDTVPINDINTTKLRQSIAYVTQETYLFHDTIANNLKLSKLDATQLEIEEACRKASIHNFIKNLPMGYETKLAELGDSLSGGERQRLGMARAFLSGGDIYLLDEPTSNLDSLNEAILLKSLKEQSLNKTIILVSHRKSTMAITEVLYKM